MFGPYDIILIRSSLVVFVALCGLFVLRGWVLACLNTVACLWCADTMWFVCESFRLCLNNFVCLFSHRSALALNQLNHKMYALTTAFISQSIKMHYDDKVL